MSRLTLSNPSSNSGQDDIGGSPTSFYYQCSRKSPKDGIDTIFTFAYDKSVDNPFVAKTIQTIRKEGGVVCFVRLFCDEEELARRVNSKSRREMGKIRTKKLLSRVLKKHGIVDEMPFQASLSIGATHLPPKKSARMIVRHYRLPSHPLAAPEDIVSGSFS